MSYTFSLTKYNINDFSDAQFETAFNAMSSERKAECVKYQKKSDRFLCVAADMLARTAIAKQCSIPQQDIEFYKDENGKPYAKNREVFFNVSHSGDYAVCAVSNSQIGVDIEKIRPVKLSTVRFFCSPKDIIYIFEQKNYQSLLPSEITNDMLIRFFEVWTFKEAYFKCSGIGISRKAASVSFCDYKKYIEHFNNYIICVYQSNMQ